MSVNQMQTKRVCDPPDSFADSSVWQRARHGIRMNFNPPVPVGTICRQLVVVRECLRAWITYSERSRPMKAKRARRVRIKRSRTILMRRDCPKPKCNSPRLGLNKKSHTNRKQKRCLVGLWTSKYLFHLYLGLLEAIKQVQVLLGNNRSLWPIQLGWKNVLASTSTKIQRTPWLPLGRRRF